MAYDDTSPKPPGAATHLFFVLFKRAQKTPAILAPQIRSQHAKQKMLVLRHFKALCCFGVFLGGLSFLLAIIAIATDPWFEALSVVESETNRVIFEEFNKLDENTTATTNIAINESTTTPTTEPEVLIVTEGTMLGQSGLWHLCHRENKADSGEYITVHHLSILFIHVTNNLFHLLGACTTCLTQSKW